MSSRKRIEFPAEGYIKRTKAPVKILARTRVAGMSAFVVQFEDGFKCEWGEDAVVVKRS